MGRLMGTPVSEHFRLSPETDNEGGAPTGQVPEEEDPLESGEMPEETGQDLDVQEEEQEPFFSHKFDDGEEKAFRDANELRGFIRDGVLRHRDYTKKTQTVAEERKQLEAEKQKQEAEYAEMLKLKQEHDKIQEYLQSLQPHVYETLKKQVAQGKSGGQYNDPRVDKIIQEREAEKKAQQTKEEEESERQQREKAFSYLEEQFPDFNRKEVLSLAKQIEEAPPGEEMRVLMETLYYANKGKMSPAEIEKRVAQNLERKKNVKAPIAGGGSPPQNKGAAQFNNTDEALEAALNEMKE